MAKLQRRMRRAFTPELETEAAGLWPVDPELEALERKLRRGSQAEAAHKAGRWPRSELAPMSRGMKVSLVIALLIIGAGLPIMVHVLRTLAGGFRYTPGQ